MVWQLHLRCATICLLTSSDGLSSAPHPDNILFNFQNTEKRIAPRKNNNNTSLFSIKIFLNPFAWAFYMRLKREKYNKIEKISRYGEKIMHDIPKMILKPVFNPLTCPISQDQQAIFAVILAGIILLFTELRLISIAMFIIAIAYYIVIYMNCNATKYTITDDSITFSEGFINCINLNF